MFQELNMYMELVSEVTRGGRGLELERGWRNEWERVKNEWKEDGGEWRGIDDGMKVGARGKSREY